MNFELEQDTKWPFEYRMTTGCGLTLFKAYPDLPPSAEISRDDGLGYERLNDAESANKIQRDALNIMAASGDLLAACEELLSSWNSSVQRISAARELAIAAIAKAKGAKQ